MRLIVGEGKIINCSLKYERTLQNSLRTFACKMEEKMARKAQKTKRREKRVVSEGNAYIQSTFNNSIVSITDLNGDVIGWASAGSVGFKGTKKGTPFAAQLAAETVSKKAIDSGMKRINVYVKGPGSGRETAIRAISATGITVNMIKDTTAVPHNGCRPKKRRRV